MKSRRSSQDGKKSGDLSRRGKMASFQLRGGKERGGCRGEGGRWLRGTDVVWEGSDKGACRIDVA